MQLIRYDHDIVAELKRDCFFFQMKADHLGFRYDELVRAAMLAWFKDWV